MRRVVHLDTNSNVVEIVFKEAIRKSYSATDIVQMTTSLDDSSMSLMMSNTMMTAQFPSLTLQLANGKVYQYQFQTHEDRDTFQMVISEMQQKNFQGIARFPRAIIHKGILEKKGKSGIFCPRFVVLVPRKLFMLRQKTSYFPLNAVCVSEGQVTYDNNLTLEITAAKKAYVFRASNPSEASEWLCYLLESFTIATKRRIYTEKRDRNGTISMEAFTAPSSSSSPPTPGLFRPHRASSYGGTADDIAESSSTENPALSPNPTATPTKHRVTFVENPMATASTSHPDAADVADDSQPLEPEPSAPSDLDPDPESIGGESGAYVSSPLSNRRHFDSCPPRPSPTLLASTRDKCGEQESEPQVARQFSMMSEPIVSGEMEFEVNRSNRSHTYAGPSYLEREELTEALRTINIQRTTDFGPLEDAHQLGDSSEEEEEEVECRVNKVNEQQQEPDVQLESMENADDGDGDGDHGDGDDEEEDGCRGDESAGGSADVIPSGFVDENNDDSDVMAVETAPHTGQLERSATSTSSMSNEDVMHVTVTPSTDSVEGEYMAGPAREPAVETQVLGSITSPIEPLGLDGPGNPCSSALEMTSSPCVEQSDALEASNIECGSCSAASSALTTSNTSSCRDIDNGEYTRDKNDEYGSEDLSSRNSQIRRKSVDEERVVGVSGGLERKEETLVKPSQVIEKMRARVNLKSIRTESVTEGHDQQDAGWTQPKNDHIEKVKGGQVNAKKVITPPRRGTRVRDTGEGFDEVVTKNSAFEFWGIAKKATQ